MAARRLDIPLSLASFILVACMALPSVMKLSHAIHNHQEQRCNEDIALHFHGTEFDCEFQKFKLNNQYYTELQQFVVLTPDLSKKPIVGAYIFLSTYQELHFSLRGPPEHFFLFQTS